MNLSEVYGAQNRVNLPQFDFFSWFRWHSIRSDPIGVCKDLIILMTSYRLGYIFCSKSTWDEAKWLKQPLVNYPHQCKLSIYCLMIDLYKFLKNDIHSWKCVKFSLNFAWWSSSTMLWMFMNGYDKLMNGILHDFNRILI